MEKSRFSIKIVNIIFRGMGFGSRLARKGHIIISLFVKFLYFYLNFKKPLQYTSIWNDHKTMIKLSAWIVNSMALRTCVLASRLYISSGWRVGGGWGNHKVYKITLETRIWFWNWDRSCCCWRLWKTRFKKQINE